MPLFQVLDQKLLSLAREARERAEETLTRAETFNDPEAPRMMHEIGVNYEKLARRLETECGVETIRRGTRCEPAAPRNARPSP